MCLFTSLRKVTKIFFTLWNVHEVEEMGVGGCEIHVSKRNAALDSMIVVNNL